MTPFKSCRLTSKPSLLHIYTRKRTQRALLLARLARVGLFGTILVFPRLQIFYVVTDMMVLTRTSFQFGLIKSDFVGNFQDSNFAHSLPLWTRHNSNLDHSSSLFFKL